MDAAQYRAALQALGWTEQQLAGRTGLEADTVARIGRDAVGSDAPERDVVRRSFEAAGIDFADGGARLRPSPRDEGVAPEDLTTENDR